MSNKIKYSKVLLIDIRKHSILKELLLLNRNSDFPSNFIYFYFDTFELLLLFCLSISNESSGCTFPFFDSLLVIFYLSMMYLSTNA